jgi:hypothetical protein
MAPRTVVDMDGILPSTHDEADNVTSLPGEPLETVRRAAQAVVKARDGLVDAVAVAREAGLSYAAIGEALGVSRQAAWERFAAHVSDRNPSEPA